MSQGRGRRPKIEQNRYPELLTLLRSGLSMPATAAHLGVARATLYNLAERDQEIGDAMQRARAQAHRDKQARHEPSESCYVNNRCRAPECTTAATEARARRRARLQPVEAPPALARTNVYALLADDTPPLADSA
ncbi:helix-turn-helix resolvase-like protein [Streptomyces sp. Ag109_O5-1]|uniref:helix-turn-helix domain-containing protein n=1 Tax=Streptomyces sp. Ag109_O5-1 TaxID=1938851 RepID=UPI000F4E1751|nr:helix-turn-helix domain-containing protein [Streptomyces sp. Ag109_O5-1]RPE39696.1 helix-turn-helix resolvase-like protein [Streptomyces sp. Ag109_O5-1]